MYWRTPRQPNDSTAVRKVRKNNCLTAKLDRLGKRGRVKVVAKVRYIYQI